MIATILGSIGASLFLINLGHAAIVPLPSGTGPCDVTLHASELVENRTDPYNPKGGNRAIMVTTFTPANCGSVHYSSYFPNATAKYEDETFQSFGLPAGTFESFRIQTQTQNQRSVSSRDGYPVVLFSPAAGVSRLIYTLLLQDIASHGFAVISVDHPYDANIVEFPDGRTVFGNITAAEYPSAVKVRVQDMVFLRDQLSNETVIKDIFPLGNTHLSLDRVTIMGHSLGGATAAQTTLIDNRFVAGINLDGSLYGSVVNQGLKKPFLLWGKADHNRSTDASWASFWNQSSGWKRELQLAQSEHYSFSDFPVLIDSLSVSEEVREVVQAAYTGTIGALRARNVVSVYVVAALRYFVYGHVSALLDGPSVPYPDVTFFS